MKVGKDVGAVIQAAAILRVVSNARQPLGVTAVARAATLNPSTTLNILRTLVKERFIAFDPATKTYTPDLGIVELARAMLGKTHVELLRPRLQRIANQFEATVSVWRVTDTQRLLLLERLKPETGLYIEFSTALRIPLYAGASGRAVAAVAPVERDALHQAFARIRWHTPIPFEQYCAEIDAARETGYAFDVGALIRSVVSTAAAMTDLDGHPSLVLSAHTFSGQLQDDALHALGKDLHATCTEAHAALYGTR